MNHRIDVGLLLTAAEVAAHLYVSPETVKRIPPKYLPYFKVSTRGDRRYRLADVEKYIEDRTIR